MVSKAGMTLSERNTFAMIAGKSLAFDVWGVGDGRNGTSWTHAVCQTNRLSERFHHFEKTTNILDVTPIVFNQICSRNDYSKSPGFVEELHWVEFR